MRKFNRNEVRIRNVNAEPEIAQVIFAEYDRHPSPDVWRVADLEPTPREAEIMTACFDALDAFIAMLGIGPIAIDRSLVHLIGTETVKTRDSDVPGWCNYGNVYVQRQLPEREAEFVLMFTHEIAHLASYLRIEVIVERKDGRLFEEVHTPRLGLAAGNSFRGLNEAVTEMMAHMIRRQLLKRDIAFPDSVREKIVSRWHYYPHVLVTEEVLKRQGDLAPMANRLFRDALLGTYGLLRKISRTQRGVIQALRVMNRTVASAHEVAITLGAHDAERIASESLSRQAL